MKKFYAFSTGLVFLISMLAMQANAQSFTAGNLAVFQAQSATANNTAGNIVEIPVVPGTAVIHAIPDGATDVSGLRFSGSATSTGYLANSNDGTRILFTGANSNNTGVNSNTLTARGVGSFIQTGTYNLATTYTGTSGNQPRAATTVNNTAIFISDQGGIYTNGSTSASPSGNFRSIKAFGGVVYFSSASATLIQVNTLSAPSGGTVTPLPGLTSNASLQDFYLVSSGTAGAAVDILYVLSATNNTAGSITKYSLVSGTWTSNGSYTTTFGGFGLAAKRNGSSTDLFLSTGQGALAANRLLKVTDSAGYNAPIAITTIDNVTLYTAPAGTTLKGVAFAPVAAAPPTVPTVNLSVTANAGSEANATVITLTVKATDTVSTAQTITLSVGGTGITSGDFTLSGTTITIAQGDSIGTATFTIIDDALIEGTETAVVTISNPSAGIALGATTTQNIAITDNDVPVNPTVNLSVSTNVASEQNGTVITVTATASAAVSGNQTVTLAVTGTGVTTNDYNLSSVTITIPAGQTTGSVTLQIRNDAEAEGTETAVLTISNPSAGITLGGTVSQSISVTDNSCQVLIRKSTGSSANGAEISAFDPSTARVFTVAGSTMEYYTLNSAGILSAPANMPFGFVPPAGTNAVPNSVVVRNGIVAVAYAIVNASTAAQQPGVVAFYQSSSATYISSVTVGYLPDMMLFSPDGTKVLTANEGEPNSYGQGNSFDPEGSVSIIDISAGVATATVTTAGFTSFNANIVALRAAGVRIFGPGATVAQDFEPEYIALTADGTKAFVALQENNAVAELDLATATFTQIIPLGRKNHSLAGNGLDASDRDSTTSLGRINIQNWPIFGMYQPDAMAGFSVGGNNYFITANEGDSRAYTGFSEEIRVGASGYVLDPTVFPNAATLKLNENLGRLQLTNATGDTNGDGDFDRIDAFGARSFSIWSQSFTQIFDSGDQLEQITAAQNRGRFNADNTDNSSATFDTRSDNKGPEPEAVTTGTVNGVLYAFVGVERSGDIFVYDISNPAAPVFKQYIDNLLDFGVEGLIFVPANQSPTGKPLLISSAEVSLTVSVYEFSLVPDALATTNTTFTAVQDSVSSYGDCGGLIARVAKSGAAPIAGSVTAKVFIESSVPSVGNVPFVERHYEITPASGAATATGTVTLYFTQAEFDRFNNDPNSTLNLPTGAGDAAGKSNLLVTKYAGTSNDGSGLPGSYAGTPVTIDPADAAVVYNSLAARWEVSFDVTGFSGFFIQTAAGVVPTRLVSFTAKAQGANSLLEWRVVNEVNTLRYDAEYSIDGLQFFPLGSTTAAGQNTAMYRLIHENAAGKANKLFYRLKVIGNSAATDYLSDVVTVRFGNGDALITAVYPNPTKGAVKVAAGVNALSVTLKLTDLSGRTLYTTNMNGGLSTTIDLGKYPGGVYILEAATADGRREQFKLVKE